MKNKPRALIIVALLQILAPVGNVVIGFLLTGKALGPYWQWLTHAKGHFWLDNVIVPLIAFIAIYAVKIWSLPVFFCTLVWNVVQQQILYTNYANPMTKPILIMGILLNFGLV